MIEIMQCTTYIGTILRIMEGLMYDFEHTDQRLIAYVNIFICANRLQAIENRQADRYTFHTSAT